MSTKKKSTVRQSQQEVAYHEAGHAVITLWRGLVLDQVTIVPNKKRGSLGHALHERPPNFLPGYEETQEQIDDTDTEVMGLLAGMEAQSIYSGQKDYDGAGADHREAHLLAETRCNSSKEIGAYLKWLTIRTRSLLRTELWPHVQALAAALLKRRTLSGAQAKSIYYSVWRKLAREAQKRSGRVLPPLDFTPRWPGHEIAETLPAHLQNEVMSFTSTMDKLRFQQDDLVHKLKQADLSVAQIAKQLRTDKDRVKAILRS